LYFSVTGAIAFVRPEAGAVRAEHVLDAVLLDQPLGELCAAGRGRLVVVVDDLELVGLPADLDAAHLVDALDGKLVTVLRVDAVGRIFAGQRDRRTEYDGVALDLGLRRGCRQ
jgi:hypothetical protein